VEPAPPVVPAAPPLVPAAPVLGDSPDAPHAAEPIAKARTTAFVRLAKKPKEIPSGE
jgi:hypothetical protein